MKRLVLCFIFFMLLSTSIHANALAAAQSVRVTLPTFKVTLNGTQVESSYREYPLIVYKGITYFPMTYYDCRYLGLQTNWNSRDGLEINNTGISGMYRDYKGSSMNNRSFSATIVNTPVRLNGKKIDNANEEYPLLLFRGLTYFPLTWRFAVDEFGWDYSFSHAAGLVINSTNPVVVTQNIAIASPSADGSSVNTSFIVMDGYYYIRGGSREIYKGSLENPGVRSLVYMLYQGYWPHQNVYFYSRGDQLQLNYLWRDGGELTIDGTVIFEKDGSWKEVPPFWENFGSVSITTGDWYSSKQKGELYIRYGDGEPIQVGDPSYEYGRYWDCGRYQSGGSESRSLFLIGDDIYTLARDTRDDNSTIGIYKVNTKTNSTTRVTDAYVLNFKIEGDRIYFVNQSDYRVYSMPLAGGEPTPLTGVLNSQTMINENSDIQVLNGKVYYIIDKPWSSEHSSRFTLYRTGNNQPINSSGNASSIRIHGGYIVALFDSIDGSAYRMMVFNANGDVVFKTSDNVIPTTVTVDNDRLYYIDSESMQVGMVELRGTVNPVTLTDNPAWVEAYADYITHGNRSPYLMLVDVDFDDIPELFIYSSGYGANMWVTTIVKYSEHGIEQFVPEEEIPAHFELYKDKLTGETRWMMVMESFRSSFSYYHYEWKWIDFNDFSNIRTEFFFKWDLEGVLIDGKTDEYEWLYYLYKDANEKAEVEYNEIEKKEQELFSSYERIETQQLYAYPGDFVINSSAAATVENFDRDMIIDFLSQWE